MLDNKLSYLKIDVPKGYIARIRRLEPVAFPASAEGYSSRMPALFEIAYNGFQRMNDTLATIETCKSSLRPIIGKRAVLPPALAKTSSKGQ